MQGFESGGKPIIKSNSNYRKQFKPQPEWNNGIDDMGDGTFD